MRQGQCRMSELDPSSICCHEMCHPMPARAAQGLDHVLRVEMLQPCRPPPGPMREQATCEPVQMHPPCCSLQHSQHCQPRQHDHPTTIGISVPCASLLASACPTTAACAAVSDTTSARAATMLLLNLCTSHYCHCRYIHTRLALYKLSGLLLPTASQRFMPVHLVASNTKHSFRRLEPRQATGSHVGTQSRQRVYSPTATAAVVAHARQLLAPLGTT